MDISYEQLKINYFPLVFAGLGALDALLGGGASIASAGVSAKDKTATLEEQKRHNKKKLI